MYKQDLALNNLQCWYAKIQPNQIYSSYLLKASARERMWHKVMFKQCGFGFNLEFLFFSTAYQTKVKVSNLAYCK